MQISPFQLWHFFGRPHTGLPLRRCALVWMMCWLATASISVAQTKPAKPKFLATNLKGFGIPFRINADDESFIEVQLYVSTDQGRTWRFLERQTTDKSEFQFQADGDGDYWFAIKTLNRNRQLIPEGKPTPELIIQVDTALPELTTFEVQADAAGRIECRWKAFDKNLKTDSLQISYQAIGAAPDDWKTVPVSLTGMVRNGSYADQLAWWPETTERSLNVRLAISDQAGNTIFKERRINVAPSPWRHRSTATARGGEPAALAPFNPLHNPLQPTPALNNSAANSANSTSAQPVQSGISAWKPATGIAAHPSANPSAPEMQCENGVCIPLNQPAAEPLASQTAAEKLAPQRTAGGGQAGHELPQIGSPPIVSAPPNPDLFSASPDLYGASPDRLAGQQLPQSFPRQTPQTNSPGVNWESEPERWTRQNQINSGTARSPAVNPQLPPSQRNLKPENLQLPNPNPNQITRDDQHVIGQSSTQFPNQYQGLPAQQQPIAAPEFLTGEEASNWSGDDGVVEEPDSNLLTSSPPTANFGQQSIPSQSQRPIIPSDLPNSNSSMAQLPRDVEAMRDRSTGSPMSSTPMSSAPMSSASYRSDDSAASVMDESGYDASIQMIPSKRFRLNYAVDAIDPSGVARVDLWMTRDGGNTWKTWGTDPDNQSPFPVEVEEEGRYGFRIVIHSRDGLTGRGPSRGDRPDIFVHVDTQAPLAQIVSVPYGRGPEAGRLIINYRVNDAHLTLRPISLFYSTSPQGPWTAIEEGLRNDGRYVWKPTTNVPDRVFLRLDALDRAGNRGTHSLTQAIDISGLIPRGTIQGVVPVDTR